MTDAARYLYCFVRVDETVPSGAASSDEADANGGDGSTDAPDGDVPADAPDGDVPADEALHLDATGIDGARPRVLVVGDVGVVVHETDGLYDTDDPDEIERWLIAHQNVVEAAMERFGTPLPCQFDLVVEGGDDAVVSWLEGAADRVADALDRFAGHREYRIDLVLAEDAPLPDPDGELAALERRREAADEGTAFLVEKQYEQRRQAARRERAAALTDRLEDAIGDVVTEHDREAGGGDDDAIARTAVLAPLEREAELGDRLDPIAAEEGVEIRFTGPWAPYSFAPTFEEGQ